VGSGLRFGGVFVTFGLLMSVGAFGEQARIKPDEVLTAEDNAIAANIWQTHLPQSGQSLTVEGELIRAVEKLRDEAQRNGNGNRDSGHIMLVDYLAEKLGQDPVFDAVQRMRIRKITDELRQDDLVELEDEPYDYLTSRIVQFYRYYGSQPREINPDLRR
jgi:CheY-like chemotaxis protein